MTYEVRIHKRYMGLWGNPRGRGETYRKIWCKGSEEGAEEGTHPEDIIRQNQWKRVRELRRLVKWNFTTGDSWITLTYQKDKRVSWEEMIKHMQKFIRQLQTRYRKYGWILKYIWRPQIGKRGAIHIHILLNAEQIQRPEQKRWSGNSGHMGIRT